MATRDPVQIADEWATWLHRTGLADGSQKAYADRGAAFARWLVKDDHREKYAEAWTDEHVRDWAARDYRRELLTVDKRSPSTVAAHISAVGSVFTWYGIGKPKVPGVDLPPPEFKGLDDEQVRTALRHAERRGPRELALVALMALAGPRVGEVVPLDVDDVLITDRKGVVSIRYGKGGRPRRVPIGPQARDALTAWKDERKRRPGADTERALFLAERGGRLAQRSIQHAVSLVGHDAGLRLHPHMLRHTFARRWIEAGGDLPALQQMLGHKNLQTTAIYAKPSWTTLEEQAEALTVDY